MPIFGGKLESSCWCCLFFSALLQFRQLWERITRIAHGRRQEWWDCFGLAQCIGQHQAPCQDWAELPEAKLGVNCRSWQGIWGLARGAIIALLLDSRNRHKPDQLESDNKTCIDSRNRGLNTGRKGQKPSQASREAWFYRAAAVPILLLWLLYTDLSQRCWSLSLLLPGKGDWRAVTRVRLC